MKSFWILSIALLLFVLPGRANNIRIDSVSYNSKLAAGVTRVTMKFTVVWENSWRDVYNYDAAYVFFKFKRKETGTAQAEPWNHLFLASAGHELVTGFKGEYDFWLAPLSAEGTEFNTGVYIFRKGEGVWSQDSVQMNATWDVSNQMLASQLTADDIRNGQVQVVGHAVEMVFVPRGAYRIGDGVSNKGFRKQAFPILSEYDIVTKSDSLEASCGDPTLAADRINDNSNNVLSEWSGQNGTAPWWWMIDFGKGKTRRITYFGVNASKYFPANIPTTFKLEGTLDPEATTPHWVPLWEGPGDRNWVIANDAYPVEKALRIAKPEAYRAYRLTVVGMKSGFPVATTIGMTEKNLDALIDYSVLIDNPVTVKDSMRQLGASDGSVWTNGEIPATFPNGYCGFYAMKYELSQDQYASFLNKQTYRQQNGLLGGRLDELNEGDYIFGSKEKPDRRNGIIVATKIEGMPAVFACDLDGDKVAGGRNDGLDIACNYMNVHNMLAYADWACLRPLSEMEYEKMCRPCYPVVPVKRSFAWGTTLLVKPEANGIAGEGTPGEMATVGNANWGGVLNYPLRVGAFARPDGPTMEKCGSGYWGGMDLCGNLAEIYYNVNKLGLALILPEKVTGNATLRASHFTAHGDGLLTDDGGYNGAATQTWQGDADMFAVRGGCFASDTALLRVSDRTLYTGAFETILRRDSSVTFRLGHSAPAFPEIQSWLITENETTTVGGGGNDFFLNTTTYTIRGNKPQNPQGGAINYIWYSAESGGEMKVMEGETNEELYFSKYKSDSVVSGDRGLNFVFKRKAITPFTDSETSSKNMLSLITNPFNEAEEIFTYTTDSYQVKSNWTDGIPHKWGLEGVNPGLTINEKTGVISGLNAAICRITVTLICTQNPAMVYRKKVRETVRNYSAVNGSIRKLTLPPGSYDIECWGASGGTSSSALSPKGAYAKTPYEVAAPTLVSILVGMQGGWGSSAGGGGGGSFVVAPANAPVCIAGGGGGNQANNRISEATFLYAFGQATQQGGRHSACGAAVLGNGGLGNTVSGASGGGGLLGNGGGGDYGRGGIAFVNGGASVLGTGQTSASGGFGGGASTHGGSGGGGGAGGYTGGSGGNHNNPWHGGGGGSYYLGGGRAVAGYNSMPAPGGGNESGHYGHGYIRITLK